MTVKLWDLDSSNLSIASQSFSLHSDKVSSCQWHPISSTILASGGYDQKIVIFDIRSPKSHIIIPNLNSDIESLKWDPLSNGNELLVALENGIVQCFDVRHLEFLSSSPSKGTTLVQSLYTLQAHDKAVTTMDISPLVPGCLITGSTDKTVKVWDTQGNKPTCVVSRDFIVGKVFSVNWNPDTPLVASMAGSKGKVVVWNGMENEGMRSTFRGRLKGKVIEPELDLFIFQE